jgi:hypothetical protein
MPRCKIYLAGPFGVPYKGFSEWRDFVKNKAPLHSYWDPRYDTDQSSYVTIGRDDIIKGIEGSELFFGYKPKNTKDVAGLCTEAGVAFGRKIPIVFVDENDFIHPFPAVLAKRLFTNLEIAVMYLYNSSNPKPNENEFVAIYKTMHNKRQIKT